MSVITIIGVQLDYARSINNHKLDTTSNSSSSIEVGLILSSTMLLSVSCDYVKSRGCIYQISVSYEHGHRSKTVSTRRFMTYMVYEV